MQLVAMISVVTATILWLGIAAGVLATQSRPAALDANWRRGADWFAAEGLDEFIFLESRRVPPIEHAGKKWVKVYFYGCNNCLSGNSFLGYYEKYTDEAKLELERLMQSLPTDGAIPPETEARLTHYTETGRMLSRDGRTWVPAKSEEGDELMGHIRATCVGEDKLMGCLPW